MKLRRSMLFVPGSNAAMVTSSFIYPADSIIFDLEDSVSIKEKDSARLLVHNVLSHPFYKDFEKVVRVNPLDSAYGIADVNAVIKGGVDVIRLPKTDNVKDIMEMDDLITKLEVKYKRVKNSVKMMAAIESAEGINNIVAIAKSSKRLVAIALGAEDYVRNLKTQRSNNNGIELLFARCSILQAAREAGIMAIDTVFTDIEDEAGFIYEAELIKQLGFDGKSLINPKQISLIHNIFAPTQDEVDFAKSVITIAEEAEANGLGVASLHGKMIDRPIIDRALLTLEKAKNGIRYV